MKVVDVYPGHPLWERVGQLYRGSFPAHERRRSPSHARATADSHFHTVAAVEDGELAGLLFWWEGEGFVFVEHLAVNPAIRGRGTGTWLLEWLMARNPEAITILEIDPPVDEVSRRRLHFYERLGFVADPTPYFHKSYAVGGLRHELVLLSRPRLLTPGELEAFIGFIFGVVLQYIDPKDGTD